MEKKVSREPLKPSGTGWLRKPDRKDPACWKFRAEGAAAITGILLFFAAGVGISALAAGAPGLLVVAALPLAMDLCIIFSLRRTPAFNFDAKCFYRGGGRPKYGDDYSGFKDYVPFSDIASLQVVGKYIRAKQSFMAWELNLVKKDGSRVNVCDSRDQKGMEAFARDLAEKLKIPVDVIPYKSNSGTKAPLWPALIFLVPFSIAASVILFLDVLQPLMDNNRAEGWKPAPAVVVKSKLDSARRHRSRGGSYRVYRVNIVFNYVWEGKLRTSGTYSMFSRRYSSGRSDKERVLKNFPAGKNTTCYVNPEDPDEAVLSRAVPKADLAIQGGGLAVFALIGWGVFFTVLVRRRMGKPRRKRR